MHLSTRFYTSAYSSNVSVSGDKIPKASEHESHTPGYSSSDDVDGPLSHSSTSSSGGSKTKWETMIVVALNLSRLDVATNMSSVMGQTL